VDALRSAYCTLDEQCRCRTTDAATRYEHFFMHRPRVMAVFRVC